MNDDDPKKGPKAAADDLAALRQEHADLEASIDALENQPVIDQLLIARLKRKKLVLRDQIVVIEDRNTPDIIA
jgi:hypothetical protein